MVVNFGEKSWTNRLSVQSKHLCAQLEWLFAVVAHLTAFIALIKVTNLARRLAWEEPARGATAAVTFVFAGVILIVVMVALGAAMDLARAYAQDEPA